MSMKPYLTSFLRVTALAMLLYSLSFFSSQKASANCDYFTLQTQDTTWSFTANAGSSQSRTLMVMNNSDSTLSLSAVVNSSSLFTLNHTVFQIPAHDTVGVVITFTAPTGSNTTTVNANIRFAKYGTDCRQYFGLYGSITGSNNGGGDKAVVLEPGSYDFGMVSPG